MNNEKLAINGGAKAIDFELNNRFHFGVEEKTAALKLFDEAIETGNAIGYNGPCEDQYCADFAEFMGGGFADGVNSGTNSVFVALKAINPEPFTEIIVGAVTDPGGMMPIPLLNCIPVVADAAPGCYNSGPKEIEELISPLTSAILIAHIGGEPVDIEAIVKIAKKYDIPVIEDCSQSHGAKFNGKMVGSFGDIAAYSVMFGKHHCTGGQGGMVFTKSEELYWKIRRSADRGKPFNQPGATNGIAALNMNLDELSCAIGIEQLKKLPGIVERRQAFAEKLRPELETINAISIPDILPGAEHSYWWWRLRVNLDNLSCTKAEYCEALLAEGVLLTADYSAALPHTFDWFKNKSVFGTSQLPWSSQEYTGDKEREFATPNALNTINTSFNLKIHENWAEKEATAIIKAFKKVSLAFAK